MALKTILYIILLFFGIAGSVTYHPLIGILGYLVTYNINPASHWWGVTLLNWGIRYSFFLAAATGLGIIFRGSKLKFNKLFEAQEILLIVFLGIIWLSIPLGFGFNQAESNAVKMLKIVTILLMASHIITELKYYEIMIWTFIISGLYLGYETYAAPSSLFSGARFDRGIGGSDFSEGNFLGAHFAMLLPFIGIQFLKGSWKKKVVCLISGVFVVNAIILCRSRGVFLAIIVGLIAAVIFSLSGYRRKILVGIVFGLVGGVLLTDPEFWPRMMEININENQMDASSQGRIMAWKAALSMAGDHPFGVGEANFQTYVGRYNPAISGKDTHNTFFRCLAELGFQGAFVLLLLIGNAFRIMFSLKKDIAELPNREDFLWHIYALKIALVIYLVSGIFITHTYIEEFYWLLMFPLFLKRSVQNEIREMT